jgi:hypothetical protein
LGAPLLGTHVNSAPTYHQTASGPRSARHRSKYSASRAPSVHFRNPCAFGPLPQPARLRSVPTSRPAPIPSSRASGGAFIPISNGLRTRARFPGLPTRAQCPANICGEVLQHLGVCFLECMWALGPSCHCSHVRLVQGCARCPFVLPTCHFATAPHSRACHAPMGECGVVCGSAPMPAPRAPTFGPSLATKLRFAQPGAQASLLGRERKAPMQV